MFCVKARGSAPSAPSEPVLQPLTLTFRECDSLARWTRATRPDRKLQPDEGVVPVLVTIEEDLR
jgi:hypothetical protein